MIDVTTSDYLSLFLQLNKQVYEPKGRRFSFKTFGFERKNV